MRLKSLAARLDPWAPPIALMALIFFLSGRSDVDPDAGTLDVILRKIAHAAEYGLLWFLWQRALRTLIAPLAAGLAAAAIAIVYAVSDEFHQTFVDNRHGTVLDVGIDSVGVALAALALAFVSRRRSRQPAAASTRTRAL